MKHSVQLILLSLILYLCGHFIGELGKRPYHEITGSIMYLGAIIFQGLSIVLDYFETRDKK